MLCSMEGAFLVMGNFCMWAAKGKDSGSWRGEGDIGQSPWVAARGCKWNSIRRGCSGLR